MRRPSRRTVLGVAAVAAVVLVVANIAGVLRYPGGPLRPFSDNGVLWLDWGPANQGNNRVGISADANVGTGVPIYIGIEPRNQGPWPVTIERVRLINATPGLQLVETRLVRPDSRPGGAIGIGSGHDVFMDELGLFDNYETLPAVLAGNHPIEDGRMWLAVVADAPGRQSFDTIEVDYRLGPFSFSVNLHHGFGGCIVPIPDGVQCSWDAE
jgi:hypothetical protein